MSIRSMKLTVISSLLGEKKKYRASSVIIVGFSFTEGAMSIYSMSFTQTNDIHQSDVL